MGLFKVFIERSLHPPQEIVVVLHALVQGVLFLDDGCKGLIIGDDAIFLLQESCSISDARNGSISPLYIRNRSDKCNHLIVSNFPHEKA